jgi:hypothetical protein
LTPHSNPNDDLTDNVEEEQQVVTVEAYVAAMEEKDAQDRSTFETNMDAAVTEAQDNDDDIDEHNDKDDTEDGRQNSKESKADNAPSAEETAAATVGVKSHNSDSKKSNAVGDPDGEGSDDSDDDTDEWGEDMADMDIFEHGEMEDLDLIGSDAQVQVELELLEEEDAVDDANSEEEESEEGSSSTAADATRGGGVGVRLAGRLNRRKHRNSKDLRSNNSGSSSTPATKTTVLPEELLAAWQSHVYLPPTAAALQYLTEHARAIDGASKTRLDRRTMYASLLLEWRNSNGSPSARKFLEQPTSQALQAALSLATQPAWRKSFPRPSGIRLYDLVNHANGGSEHRGCATLAMQETIAMALVSKQQCV